MEKVESGTVSRPSFPLKLCLLFTLYVVAFHVLIWAVTPENDLTRLVTASVVGRLLDAAGVMTLTDGVHIMLKNANWIVTPECTAINVVILFASFVLAYGASMKSKALAITIGLPVIVTANIARLFVLGWGTDRFPQYSRFLHDYLWQGVFFLLTVGLWLTWIELVVKREKKVALSQS